MNFKKIRAFVIKDFIIESSYKVAFAVSLVNALFPVLSYFFLSKIIKANSASLEKYGGDYFSFALIGIAFTSYFTVAVGTFSSTMRRSQMAGCLEAILSSQTTSSEVVLMSSVYSFISALIQLAVIFAVGIVFFHFNYSNINIVSTIIVFILSLLVFVSLGIFSAAGTIMFKKGEPFGWIFGSISALIGGAYFPIDILPQWMQYLSILVPVTYTLEALRLSILKNFSVGMLYHEISILTVMGLALFPLSLIFFNWAVVKGKKNGTLVQY